MANISKRKQAPACGPSYASVSMKSEQLPIIQNVSPIRDAETAVLFLAYKLVAMTEIGRPCKDDGLLCAMLGRSDLAEDPRFIKKGGPEREQAWPEGAHAAAKTRTMIRRHCDQLDKLIRKIERICAEHDLDVPDMVKSHERYGVDYIERERATLKAIEEQVGYDQSHKSPWRASIIKAQAAKGKSRHKRRDTPSNP